MNGGGHVGETVLETGLDDLLRRPGVIAVKSAGIVVAGVPLCLQRWRLRARTRTLETRVRMLETAVEERTRAVLGQPPPTRPPTAGS